MKPNNDMPSITQYSLGKIILIWAAAALPMGLLGWLVAPALAQYSPRPGMMRMAVLTLGLIWQFVMVLYLIRKEAGTLKWSVIRSYLWLRKPAAPGTDRRQGRYWWWLIPLLLVTALYQMKLGGHLAGLWIRLFPFFAEPEGFALGSALADPAVQAQLKGAWDFLGLFVVMAVFNTFVGEELLFRGLLLPRMAGVFGKWDWVMNGLFFGLYHIHQPWGMAGSALVGMLFFALPSRLFKSSWFGISAHSGQSIFFAFLLLGLVLGLA